MRSCACIMHALCTPQLVYFVILTWCKHSLLPSSVSHNIFEAASGYCVVVSANLWFRSVLPVPAVIRHQSHSWRPAAHPLVCPPSEPHQVIYLKNIITSLFSYRLVKLELHCSKCILKIDFFFFSLYNKMMQYPYHATRGENVLVNNKSHYRERSFLAQLNPSKTSSNLLKP